MKRQQTKQQLLSLVFSKEGLLARSLPSFEERIGQREMAGHVLEAYEQEEIILVEAGTGIGKSLAYLFPAVYWALKHQEKTVIATHTIALQEQLLKKDLPFLLKLLDVDVKVCLVKGMSNYVCLRRLYEHVDQLFFVSTEENTQFQAICSFVESKQEGSFSQFPFAISPSAKEKVAAEPDTCNHVHCPYYKKCFFFKERKEAQEAQILIVNQHVLLADVQKRLRNPSQEAILPSYHRVVIDEVHHFEQIALESFAQKWDRIDCLRSLGRLHSESHPEKARLTLLKKTLASLSQIPSSLLHSLEIEIPAQKRECQRRIEECCEALTAFFTASSPEKKARLTEERLASPVWQGPVGEQLHHLADALFALSLTLRGVLKELEQFKDTALQGVLSAHSAELGAIAQKMEMMNAFLVAFADPQSTQKRVRWYEEGQSNLTLVDASLDVSSVLHEHFFSPLLTAVLCSATVATAKSFDFLKKRLGLSAQEARIQEHIFDSPFDYQQRVLFTVPVDFPAPSSTHFTSACIESMARLIEISKGSVFLLFTSYDMLQQCYQALFALPLSSRYPFLKQGQLPRHQLLELFKSREGSVLFATDSFWEGVDVPGEALRCVVIVKLPFSVPKDPLYEAYAESLEQEGLDSFVQYSVPQAVIKFKQGFGRLMRKKEDRGCIVCLDHRMIRKGYGAQFLKSLPPCQTYFGNQEEMFVQMRLFYDRVKVSGA